jgi:hypothetical protein
MRVASDQQIFATEQHAHAIESGPGLVFVSYVPDMHHTNGRGGRVLPLYRLCRWVGQPRARPGVRVTPTADPELWAQAVQLGKRVLWLHTYGERFADPAEGRPSGPPKPGPEHRAKVQIAIPGTAEDMPDDISYDAETATLHVGAGRISPVRPEVWAYEVSAATGRQNPAGRKSSPLDDIHTQEWSGEFTTDLLLLLNVLTLCVELEPDQADLLEKICNGPLVTVADLEQANVFPGPAGTRKPPTAEPPKPRPCCDPGLEQQRNGQWR